MKSWILAVAAVVAALLLAFVPIRVGPSAAQMGPMPQLDQLSGDDFDRAFLMQMSMHHAMAVLMARPVAANASHQELKALAGDIIADQTREIAQMSQWSADWYGVPIPDPVAMMDAMGGAPPASGHEGHGMPGMSKPQGQGMPMSPMHEMSMMADLWALPPARLEATFMSLMIPHHQSAIDMATLVSGRANHQELTDLAQAIIQSQGEEISTMNNWLASWYGL